MLHRKRLLVPEVVQSSEMDCGPAALKAFVEGHGVSVSYGRLREACQTDLDGTAIETLEDIANELDVRVEQVLLPKDVVLLEEAGALPCIAVMRLPNGNTHFVVIWSLFAGIVQVMDPGSGRRWMTRAQLLHELFEHAMPVPAADWREWASSEQGLSLVRKRLGALGVSKGKSQTLVARALSDPGWRGLAALDAAVRAVASMIDAGACKSGSEAFSLIATLLQEPAAIPPGYWATTAASDTGDEVVIRGAVLLRIDRDPEAVSEAEPTVARAIEAARDEAPARPAWELWSRIRQDGLLTPMALTAAFAGAAAAVVIEALLFRSLLELAPLFGLSEYRVGIVGALVAFMLVALVIDYAAITGELRVGRRLEARLRVAFQEKIPKLGDRYFGSRLTSDMAERNHSIHLLRTLPKLGGQILRTSFELVLTTVAIIWLEPGTAPIVLLVLAASLAIPLLGQPVVQERDLRVRSHVGALSRFYLDALLGLVPIRAHGAQHAMRTEHESLLVEWVRARLGLLRTAVSLEAVQFVVGFGLIVMLLFSYLNDPTRAGEPAAVLLLAYWALNLPVLGLQLVWLAWRYPEQRNTTLRVTEPLRASEEAEQAPRSQPGRVGSGPTAIRIEDATVRRSGHVILENVNVDITPGSHVAIVGRSGSGKTSLFGLLLGWNFPDTGRVLVDEAVLGGGRLDQLRARTAWVDPAVQLWNRSLIENLRYGNDNRAELPLASIVEQAELLPVLEMLPQGHQTVLGEGGGLVSGGEGQRVRLGRALLRPDVSLVLLDEPFRGLGRGQRAELLRRARTHWDASTLLCVTHDVSETESFDRVLVMDGGSIVEDGDPKVLVNDEGSHYRALIDSERELMKLWADPSWRRWEIEDGEVQESHGT